MRGLGGTIGEMRDLGVLGVVSWGFFLLHNGAFLFFLFLFFNLSFLNDTLHCYGDLFFSWNSFGIEREMGDGKDE